MSESLGLLDKSLSVLELLAESSQPVGPTELAARLELNKATVYRILQVLSRRGYVSKGDRGLYTAGAKLVEVASNYLSNLELQTEAKPYLTMLYAELNLSVHLGMLEGLDTVYVERLELRPSGRDYAHVGYKSPAHCSSIGKCLMASLSGDELDETLYQCHFEGFTPNTITDPQKFREHLRVVRAQGWAMDNEEYLPGSCCVGVPVFDYRGDAIACVSVSGTKEQFSQSRLPFIIKKVQDTAALISKRMGYTD